MGIVKEHYRDFLGTLSGLITKTEKELETADEYECYYMNKQLSHYKEVKKFFTATEKWVEFSDVTDLESLVTKLESCYKSMDELSSLICDDYGNLSVLTQEEWDDFEDTRYATRKMMISWSTFSDFCNGFEI